MEGHQSPSALQSAEGVHPLLPQTGEHQTLMDTPLQVRVWAASIGAGAAEGVAPTRLDMLIFKSTDLGVEVMYMLWRLNVDAFLEQYDEASLCPHIFTSLHGYPGKWARMLDEGEDISVWDLLMHMERTFCNKHDYDAMIRTLYEVQQRDDKRVEEYMSCISKTACFLVNCTSLFPPVWMEQGAKTTQSCLVRRSSIIELHPQCQTGPNLARKASANQRPSRH